MPRPGPAAALLLAAAVACAGLGSPAAGTHPDEGLYLALGVEMHARHAWLTPTVDGVPDYTKPPLLYWAMRPGFTLLGVNLVTARLPVALSAVALAALAGAFARRTGRDPALAILLTATSLGVLRYGRLAMMDVPLAAALAAGLLATWTVAEEDSPPRRLLWAGVAGAAAALLKGPVGPLLLLVVGGGWLVVRRRTVLRSPWPWAALALGLALAAPWYVAMAHVHGAAFTGRFFGVENAGKFRVPWTAGGEALLLLAVPVLLLPWTPLVVAGDARARRLLLPWLGALLVLFTLPGLKHPHYVLPALVPCLALAARERPGRVRWAAAAVLGVVGTLAALALRLPGDGGGRLSLAAAAVALLGAAALVAISRLTAAAVAVASAAVLLLGGALPRLLPAPVPPWAWPAAGDRALFTVDQHPGLMTVLSGRPVHRARGPEGVRSALASGGGLVVTRAEWELLPEDVRARVRPLVTWDRLRGRFTASTLLWAWRQGALGPLLEPAAILVTAEAAASR